jgi:hypothetical protein
MATTTDKPKTIFVRAGNNGPVSIQPAIQGARWITDEPIEVPLTRYIRRRIEVGDLVEASAGAAPPIASGPVVNAEDGRPGDLFTSSTPSRGKE